MVDKAFLKNEIEAFVQLLWDAGFYLGHSVRTLAECAEDAAADVVTATSFMESRLLAGSMDMLNQLLESGCTSPEAEPPSRTLFTCNRSDRPRPPHMADRSLSGRRPSRPPCHPVRGYQA
jgi:[protein-PII] uridylyltransferase